VTEAPEFSYDVGHGVPSYLVRSCLIAKPIFLSFL
jgi:hypothetical protein